MRRQFMNIFIMSAIFMSGSMPSLAQFQWTSDGLPIVSTTSTQVHHSAVPDGHGGIFLTHENTATGDADIYAQWIDGSGSLRWGSNGIVVTSAGGDQKFSAIAKDGSGGAYIAWQDDVSGNLYIQHLNASGSPTWTSGGLTACSAPGEQTNVRMVADGSGGVILVWVDKRDGSSSDIYAQRFSNTGFPTWTPNGIPVTTATGNQSSHVIMEDNAGGVIAVWQDYRNGYSNMDIYAQRISASGIALWTADGIAVTSAENNQISPTMDLSGDRIIISWDDSRSGSSDIYAQALDTANGNPQWTADGVPVTTADGTQMSPRITRDGSGGAIITWADNRNLYDIYGQKLNDNGTAQWTVDGIPINESTGFQVSPEIVADNAGGAIIAWKDFRSGSDYGLYSQHIDGNASLLHSADGLEITPSNVEASQNHIIMSDESGGAITFWQDKRNEQSDIYAQHYNNNLSLPEPVQSVLLSGRVSNTIRWEFRTSQTRIHHLTLRLSTTPGDGFPQVIAQDINPAQLTYDWTPDASSSETAVIQIQAHNSQGVIIGQYEGNTFSLDTDPPGEFDLISPADNTGINYTPTFEWQATTDNLSGLDHYELWINDALVQDDLQATTHTITEQQKLTYGHYTWTVKAIDQFGYVRQAANTYAFIASEDHTPPTPFHLLSPSHNTWTVETNPVFTWEAATDTGRGLKGYQLYLDGQLQVDDISPGTTSVTHLTLTPGGHTWHVVAVDSVQNTRTSEETWTIRIDNVPPQEFTLDQPVDNRWVADSTPSFSWEASGDAGIGLAKYELIIDGDLVVDNIPFDAVSVTLTEELALTEGTHTWTVVASDALNNRRESQNVFTIGIDITQPNNFSTTSPGNEGYVVELSPVFYWETTTDDVSGIREYELWIDGELSVDEVSDTYSQPGQPFSEGSHTWYVRALDEAGNFNTSPVFSFIADSTAPEPFSLISPLEGDTLRTIEPSFHWHSTEDPISGFDRFELYLGGDLQLENLSKEDTLITLDTPLENGAYTWKVRAIDKAGNSRLSTEYVRFIIDCRAPEITSPSSATATEDVPFSYTAIANDPDGDDITITFEDYPTWLNPTGAQINGTPTEGIQDTSFVIQVTDGEHTTSQTVMLTVQAVNDPPVINSANPVTAVEDILFTYTATATDSENDIVTISFENFPAWLTPAGDQISGTPSEGIQDTTILVRASDGLLSSTLEVVIQVTPVNDPPKVISPPTTIATEDSQFVYRAAATDTDGPVLSIQFEDYPSWLAPSGPEITGMPGDGCQDTTFKVIASDNILSDTLIVSLSITYVNDAPYFNYTLPQPVFRDLSSLNWQFDLDDYVTDPDDPDNTLTWAYTLLGPYPLEISIDEATHMAKIQGTNLNGTYSVAFNVTDPHGASASDTLSVSFVITDVDDQELGIIPDDFILYDNYPNPFNPVTTIRYGIPKACHVFLGVYNMLGQQIALLVDEKQNAGLHEFQWEASNMPSGIYFYRIQAGKSWQKIRRMTLMK